MNFREHRKRPQSLSDYLSWAGLVAPGVVLNKDGSLQMTIGFRGPDVESSTPQELMAVRARMNNALKRLGSNWCVHVEAQRRSVRPYQPSSFTNRIAQAIESERQRTFNDATSYETKYYMTFTYLPPEDRVQRTTRWLVSDNQTTPDKLNNPTIRVGMLQEQVGLITDLLFSFMPHAALLNDAQTLTYLHDCISHRHIEIDEPEIPFYLDVLLADSPLTGGFRPQLGNQYLKTIGIRALVSRTVPCLLNDLNELPLEFRWVARYLPLHQDEATAVMKTTRKHWAAKRKSMTTQLKEAATKSESILIDTENLNRAADVDEAIEELDYCSYGYFTLTVTTWHHDEQIATQNARAIQQVIDGRGLTSQIEDVNAVEAWMGSLPGHAYGNPRRPLLSSLNVCDLVPLSSIWSGPSRNNHLDGPPLIQTRTTGSTPFRLSLHVQDVGHTIVAGPTGSGKSFLLALLACQWLRYEGAQVFFFDKGRSVQAMTLAMGGQFHDLGGDGGNEGDVGDELHYQPLSHIDRENERTWAHGWLLDLLQDEQLSVNAQVKQELWAALNNMAAMPTSHRTLSVLCGIVQDQEVRDTLKAFTLDGPFGRLLDANSDRLTFSHWQTFEMETLMQSPGRVTPVLMYLFHRLEQRFGQHIGNDSMVPTLLVLDEAWLFLDDTLFAGRIRQWLKVLRKLNVAVVFATQSLTDIDESTIASAIIESCPTRIFLPNANAGEPRIKHIYQQFGLNERQIQILQSAAPKRDYYYQSQAGNRLFQLAAGPLQRAFCGGSVKSKPLIDRLLKEHGSNGFAEAFIHEQGIGHVFDGLPDHEQGANNVDNKVNNESFIETQA